MGSKIFGWVLHYSAAKAEVGGCFNLRSERFIKWSNLQSNGTKRRPQVV